MHAYRHAVHDIIFESVAHERTLIVVFISLLAKDCSLRLPEVVGNHVVHTTLILFGTQVFRVSHKSYQKNESIFVLKTHSMNCIQLYLLYNPFQITL